MKFQVSDKQKFIKSCDERIEELKAFIDKYQAAYVEKYNAMNWWDRMWAREPSMSPKCLDHPLVHYAFNVDELMTKKTIAQMTDDGEVMILDIREFDLVYFPFTEPGDYWSI